MKLLKNFLDFFLSLRTAIWLMMGLILMLFFGAVIMPSREEFSTINSNPLFGWLKDNPLGCNMVALRADNLAFPAGCKYLALQCRIPPEKGSTGHGF